MAERVLTQRALNRALLARQLLLERQDMTVPRAVERIGGIQAQYAPSSYVGLWSRLAGFHRDALDQALDRRTVVQATLMRATIHVVSARDYWPLALAVREERRAWFLRVAPGGLTEAECETAAATVSEALAAGPLRQAEIDALVGARARAAVGMFVDLVRVPPSGTWAHRRADLYDRADRWLGPAPDVSPDDATELLVRRYLAAFGAAHRRDIASWAGLSVGAIAPVLDRLALRRFRSETGEQLVDLPRAALPDPDTPAPVRFLAHWDAVLLAHARRTGVLPDRHRARVFSTRNPFSLGTVLVDGAVAAGWRVRDGQVEVEEFEHLTAATRAAVREEADRLTELHA